MSSGYDIRIDELDENSPAAEQPRNCKLLLKPHQLALLQRCIKYENECVELSEFQSLRGSDRIGKNDYVRTRIGIMGDRVGSGKSFVLLALIMQNAAPTQEPCMTSYGCNKVLLCIQEQKRCIRTNMLVVPHNLCMQWEAYIKAYTNDLKVLVVNRSKVVSSLHTTNLEQYDLLLVTGTFYNSAATIIASKASKLRRVIFDEVDSVNIPGCCSIDSQFYWFVTASFGNLLYPRGYSKWDFSINKHVWSATGIKNAGFVKNLFMDLHQNVSRDLVKILVIKNKESFVQSSINLPALDNVYVLCKTPMTINILNGLVDKAIIDCLNANDVASALTHVSSVNKNTEDNLISVLIEKYERLLKNTQLRIDVTRSFEYENEQEREQEMARLERKRHELDSKIKSIKERVTSANTCCICFDDFNNKTIVPCCSNSFCFKCINYWLCRTTSCPLCKSQLSSRDLLIVQEDQVGSSSMSSPSSRPSDTELSPEHDKIKNLEIIMSKLADDAKVLIFSSYENTFSQVMRMLTRLEIRHAFLKGNQNQIRNTVDAYKSGAIKVLLVNSRSYGAGMCLYQTSDVVMFHKFDSEIEKQVIGRAHRMGRSDPLRVWYLLYENEATNV